MSKFDQSYHRVASLAEAAAEDTSQAAPRATIHAMMKGDDNAETLCGRLTVEHVKRMGVIRIVDCTECREALVAANRKQTSFAKMTDIGTPISQRISAMSSEQKRAMLEQIEKMQESGEWDRMVQKIHAEVANRKGPQDATTRLELEAASAQVRANLERDAAYLQKLRACCGYVENGTGEALTISQDDATRGWSIRIGDSLARSRGTDRSYHADGFYEVIDMAHAVEKQEN